MILADTGFFIALGNNGDRYHSRAIQVISTLREPLIQLILSLQKLAIFWREMLG